MHFRYGAFLLLLPLSACVNLPPDLATTELIPASTIINGIKCELNALYLQNKKKPDVIGLSPDYMTTIDITLKVVASNDEKISAKYVLPFTSISVSPEFGASSRQAVTVTQTSTYIMEQGAQSALKCESIHLTKLNGMGLRSWLAQNLADQRAIIVGDPQVGLVTTSVETAFGVTNTVSGGVSVGLNFIPLTVTPSVAATREDVQTLKILFRGRAAPPATSPNVKDYGTTIQINNGAKM